VSPLQDSPLIVGSSNNGKHSSLLQYGNNYDRKEFYSMGPSGMLGIEEPDITFGRISFGRQTFGQRTSSIRRDWAQCYKTTFIHDL
jgi:hypothetical protein